MKSPQMVLTGATGRIGTALQSYFAGRRPLVRVSRTAGPGTLPWESLLREGPPEGTDALLHCAWSCVPATAELATDALPDLELLVRLIARLKQMSRPPRLVFFSTGAVYGSAPERASRETDAPVPIGKYASGKLAAEELLLASGLPVCILRIGTLFGLRSHPADAQGVVAHLVRAALLDKPFHQWGQDSTKDYLHCDEFLRVLDEILALRLMGIWNVGSGVGVSLNTLRETVERCTQRSIHVEMQDRPAWDVRDNRLDIAKLLGRVSWRPPCALEPHISREIEHIQDLMQNQH